MDIKLLINTFRKNPGISKTTLLVNLEKEGPYKVHAKIRGHKFVFDKPKAMGGTDIGPTSAEMLLASTGACMISILEVWSNILEINIRNVKANISGTIDHRGRLGISEEVFPGFQNINVDFKIDTDESKENIKKLFDAMEKYCPSYNTIVNPVKISSHIRLKDMDL